MTGSDIKPNAQSGGAAITASKKARDRKPKTMRGRPAGAEQTEYEKCRISELQSRAELYRLRVKKLSGELLSRELLGRELDERFSAIKDAILQSSMSKREKEECLKSLASIPVVLVKPDTASIAATSTERNAQMCKPCTS